MFLKIRVVLVLVSAVTSFVMMTINHANSFGIRTILHDLFDNLNLSVVSQIPATWNEVRTISVSNRSTSCGARFSFAKTTLGKLAYHLSHVLLHNNAEDLLLV
jgi:hypothetical protein